MHEVDPACHARHHQTLMLLPLCAALSLRPSCSQHSCPCHNRRHNPIRATLDDEAATLERKGIAAAEAWDTVATSFLSPELLKVMTDRLEGRADIGYAMCGGYSSAARARLVFTNPELLDSVAEAEQTVLLRVSAAFNKKGNAFGAGGKLLPNLLAGIGVEFDQLGDVLFDEGSGGNGGDAVAYIVCDPAAQKTIERLLPKSLGRSTIEAAEAGLEPEGALVEMVVSRTDKREQNA